MSSIVESPPVPADVPEFFPVSLTKLIVLSICTFGLYEVYWFYKNWKLVKHHEKSDIWPAARAIFGVIFCYSLFRRVDDKAEASALPAASAGFLAVCWIVVSLLYKLPDPYWLVCFLAVLFLLPVQTAVNSINAKSAPRHDRNTQFTPWNIVGVVLGGLFFIFCVYATLYPQDVA